MLCGVKDEIFSKKNSKTYFLINSSFIEYAIDLIFFSNIANDEGAFSVTLDIFKEGGGRLTAEEFGVPFLGALPFDPGFVRGGDDGVHRIVSEPEGASAVAFSAIVSALQEQISEDSGSGLEII